jgi:alkaline phosphatase D
MSTTVSVQPLTIGPIVGVTSTRSTRLWGRGDFMKDRSGQPKRIFGVARLRMPDGAFGQHQSFKMLPHFDFTGTTDFVGLNPSTRYGFEIGFVQDNGEIPDVDALTLDWTRASKGLLKTAPTDFLIPVSFVFGSCRYILRLFGGSIFDARGDKVFRSILAQITGTQNPRPVDLLLMVGDQIYADDLNFILPDKRWDEYVQRYRDNFGREHLRTLMSQVPTYMILDDHEIKDNWSQDQAFGDETNRQRFAAAMQAYASYQLVHGPAFDPAEGTPTKLWYTFAHGCTDFFVMDLRTERFRTPSARRMISDNQMRALKSWLLQPTPSVKFVVSSVPLFPESPSDDTWHGFPEQRIEILDTIRDNNIARVVFLSGDSHCSLTSTLTASTHPSFRVLSIISSSFFWPYPHGLGNMFQLSGLLASSGSSNYVVTRTSDLHLDDNFTRVTATPDSLQAEFYERKGKLLGIERFQL